MVTILVFFSIIISLIRADDMIALPIQTQSYSGDVRGFVSPRVFTITGLKVPSTAGSGTQSICVLRFTSGNPPEFSGSTTSYDELYCNTGIPQDSTVSVSILVGTGDVIGVLGITSYGPNGQYYSDIAGQSVTLTRLIRQSSLTCPHTYAVSSEAGSNLGRVEVYYIVGCQNCLICNVGVCEECLSNYYLFNGNCYDDCSDVGAYYESTQTNPDSCQPCESFCQECSSGTTCDECNNGYYLFSNNCYDDCSAIGAYYGSTTTNPDSCQPCKSFCASCTSSTNCQECNNGYYLYLSNCYNDCTVLGAYYESTQTNPDSCQPCSINCEDCSSGTQCDECESSYYLSNGFCSTCAIILDCEECSSSSQCDVCINGFYLWEGECYDDCTTLGGFYNDDSTNPPTCHPCIVNCFDCLNTTHCSICSMGYYLSDNVCNECSFNCDVCTSGSLCTTCSPGYYIHDYSCYSDCTSLGAFFNDDSVSPPICSPCVENCIECDSSTTCIDCEVGAFKKHPGICVLDCGSGYFNDETTSECIPFCGSGCLVCLDDVTCIECSSSNFYLESGQCIDECSAGFFPNEETIPKECTPCSEGCQVCSSESSCSSCLEGYMLAGGQCSDSSGWILPVTVVLSIGGLICCLVCCLILCCLCIRPTKKLIRKLKKFSKLQNVDVLLQEQQAEKPEDGGAIITGFNVKKKIFNIDFEDVTLICVVGKGGSETQVYKASWKGEIVAFKIFRSPTFEQSNSFEEFQKELSLHASISHPNIARFFGASCSFPRIGIVLEFCENSDIVTYSINASSSGTPLSEISSAVEYLHDRDIIHRDLKSDNILLDVSLRAKLIDFGLSRIVDKFGPKNTVRIGTSSFMAPEVTLGSSYDKSIDSFSFGILVFSFFAEMHDPYENQKISLKGRAIEMVVANDANFRPDLKILSFLPSEDTWVVEFLQKLWCHNPMNRMCFKDIHKYLIERYGGVHKVPNGVEKEPFRNTYAGVDSSPVHTSIKPKSRSIHGYDNYPLNEKIFKSQKKVIKM